MEGDIINIATMIDLDLPDKRLGFILDDSIAHRADYFHSEYNKKWGVPHLFNVFLLTILIELDPL